MTTEWLTDGTLIIAGAIMLAAIFVASFCFKTAWGRWNDRSKRNEIYGEPGANVAKQKQPMHLER